MMQVSFLIFDFLSLQYCQCCVRFFSIYLLFSFSLLKDSEKREDEDRDVKRGREGEREMSEKRRIEERRRKVQKSRDDGNDGSNDSENKRIVAIESFVQTTLKISLTKDEMRSKIIIIKMRKEKGGERWNNPHMFHFGNHFFFRFFSPSSLRHFFLIYFLSPPIPSLLLKSQSLKDTTDPVETCCLSLFPFLVLLSISEQRKGKEIEEGKREGVRSAFSNLTSSYRHHHRLLFPSSPLSHLYFFLSFFSLQSLISLARFFFTSCGGSRNQMVENEEERKNSLFFFFSFTRYYLVIKSYPRFPSILFPLEVFAPNLSLRRNERW